MSDHFCICCDCEDKVRRHACTFNEPCMECAGCAELHEQASEREFDELYAMGLK